MYYYKTNNTAGRPFVRVKVDWVDYIKSGVNSVMYDYIILNKIKQVFKQKNKEIPDILNHCIKKDYNKIKKKFFKDIDITEKRFIDYFCKNYMKDCNDFETDLKEKFRKYKNIAKYDDITLEMSELFSADYEIPKYIVEQIKVNLIVNNIIENYEYDDCLDYAINDWIVGSTGEAIKELVDDFGLLNAVRLFQGNYGKYWFDENDNKVYMTLSHCIIKEWFKNNYDYDKFLKKE